jgi:phospholipid N-methyltransferase
MLTERTAFFNKFIREPRKIGSITPSSSFLTKKMLARLPWRDLETIVELGAGTGVFTRYIAKNKKEACRVLIIEQNYKMRETLRNQYPDFYYGSKAERLGGLLARYDLQPVDCVVSGLPFALFSEELRNEILAAVHRSLRPGGIFIAFQYSLQMKSSLEKYFSEFSIGLVPLNMPPAFIYYCKK